MKGDKARMKLCEGLSVQEDEYWDKIMGRGGVRDTFTASHVPQTDSHWIQESQRAAPPFSPHHSL